MIFLWVYILAKFASLFIICSTALDTNWSIGKVQSAYSPIGPSGQRLSWFP